MVGTDTIQLIFFFLAVLVGIVAIAQLNPTSLNPEVSSWIGIFAEPTIPDLATIVSFIVLGFGWLIVAMDVWQRNAATRNHTSSKNGNVWGMVVVFLISIVFVLLGMIDRSLLVPHITASGAIPVDPVTDIFNYGLDVAGNISQITYGVVAAALVTAALSTADTFLVVCGHAIMADLLVGGRRQTTYNSLPSEDSKALTIIARVLIILLGIMIVMVGYLFHWKSLLADPYTVFFIAYGVQFSLLAPLVYGSFTKFTKLRKAKSAGLSILITVTMTVGISVWALVRVTSGGETTLGLDSYTLIYLMPTAAVVIGFLFQWGLSKILRE